MIDVFIFSALVSVILFAYLIADKKLNKILEELRKLNERKEETK